MKIVAEKTPNGKYELYIDIPMMKLPVIYTADDLTVLEKNGIIRNRDSYNAGTVINFNLKMEDQERIEIAILGAVTEKHYDNK